MKKLIVAAALAAGLAIAPANAAVIDFANEADTNGERGLDNPGTITIDGVALSIASGIFATGEFVFNPYLDESSGGLPGGLGVCRELEAGPGSECADSGDDSIDGEGGIDEAVSIRFLDSQMNITGLSFRDGDHNLINDSDGLIVYQITGGANSTGGLVTDTFANLVALAASGLVDVGAIFFGFVNTDFYVESITVSDVPIPGAIPLLISGLAGLGFASKKKRKA